MNRSALKLTQIQSIIFKMDIGRGETNSKGFFYCSQSVIKLGTNLILVYQKYAEVEYYCASEWQSQET